MIKIEIKGKLTHIRIIKVQRLTKKLFIVIEEKEDHQQEMMNFYGYRT
jgi:hypothetical protein